MTKELEGLSNKRLAEIWCELNRWEKPKELESAISVNNAIKYMNEIQEKITHKECLRQWHIDQKIEGEFDYAKIMRSMK